MKAWLQLSIAGHRAGGLLGGHTKDMRVIGLTGGIASGKSLISQQLAALGATVIDADKLGHESYRPGTDTYRAVIEAFGQDVLAADGQIDRRALGGKVFGDATGEARKRLEAIVWPAIRRLAKVRIEELRGQGVSVVVLEAAVLIDRKSEGSAGTKALAESIDDAE